MDALPEDWQAVPNEKEKCEEITRLTVISESCLDWVSSLYQSIHYSLTVLRLGHRGACCQLQVPENLSDIDRATTLLLGGYPQQQKSVIDR